MNINEHFRCVVSFGVLYCGFRGSCCVVAFGGRVALMGHRMNVTLDMILGGEDILISWFVIILASLGVALLFVCCMIHCKHLR